MLLKMGMLVFLGKILKLVEIGLFLFFFLDDTNCIDSAIKEQKLDIVETLLAVSTLNELQKFILATTSLKLAINLWQQESDEIFKDSRAKIVEALIRSGVDLSKCEGLYVALFSNLDEQSQHILNAVFDSPFFNLDSIVDFYIENEKLRPNIQAALKNKFGSLDVYDNNTTFFIALLQKSPSLANQILDQVDPNFCGYYLNSPRAIVAEKLTSDTSNSVTAYELSSSVLRYSEISQSLIKKEARSFTNSFHDLPLELRPFVNPKNFSDENYSPDSLKKEILRNVAKIDNQVLIESLIDYLKKFEPQNKNNNQFVETEKLIEKPKTTGCFSWMRKLNWCGGSNSYKQLEEETPSSRIGLTRSNQN